MNEWNGRGARKKRTIGRGLTAVAATLVLVGVVVGVGATGYVVLELVSHSTSSSAHTCSPSGSPQCADRTHAVTEAVGSGVALAGEAMR